MFWMTLNPAMSAKLERVASGPPNSARLPTNSESDAAEEARYRGRERALRFCTARGEDRRYHAQTRPYVWYIVHGVSTAYRERE